VYAQGGVFSFWLDERLFHESLRGCEKRLCREAAGPGSRRGPGAARIPGGDRPDAPARVRSPAERTGAADPLASASGRSADDANRPDIAATASEKTSLWLHKRD